MLRGGKGEEGCHKCGHTDTQTHTQTEKDVNPIVDTRLDSQKGTLYQMDVKIKESLGS